MSWSISHVDFDEYDDNWIFFVKISDVLGSQFSYSIFFNEGAYRKDNKFIDKKTGRTILELKDSEKTIRFYEESENELILELHEDAYNSLRTYLDNCFNSLPATMGDPRWQQNVLTEDHYPPGEDPNIVREGGRRTRRQRTRYRTRRFRRNQQR